MGRTFGVSVLAVAIAFAAAVAAREKPPKEYQDLMRSNGAILDISLGTNRNGGNPAGPGTLRLSIAAKNYDAAAKDAATLKANFTKVEAFWAERKIDDAINFSKVAVKAAADLEAAAKRKDDAAMIAAQNALSGTCAECHQAHRVIVLADGSFEIS